MAYQKTNWVNDETPLNAENMNNIENGIEQNESDITNVKSKVKVNGDIESISLGTTGIAIGNNAYSAAGYDDKGGIAIGDGAKANWNGCISLGREATSSNSAVAIGWKANAGDGVAIGDGADAGSNNGHPRIAIGEGAKSTVNIVGIAIGTNAVVGYQAHRAIQFGAGTNNTADTLQLYNDNIYNHNTHTATLQNITQNGSPVYGVLQGTTAPDTSVVGAISQFYLDTVAKKLYQCTAINTETVDEVETTTYEWQAVSGGSGKYLHNVTFTYSSASFVLSFISTQSTSYTTFSTMCTDIYSLYADTTLPVTIKSQGTYGSAYGLMTNCRGYVPSATSTYFEFYVSGCYIRNITIDNVNTRYIDWNAVQSSLGNSNTSIVKDVIIPL